ncbi:MAG: polyisoprenoid-binding protein, partial [Roseibium sp.]|nr:polyisoprenoid-binding protein [Roseibium sp.]
MTNHRALDFITRFLVLVVVLIFGALGTLLNTTSGAVSGSISGTYNLSPGKIDTQFTVRVLGGRAIMGKFSQISGKMVLDQNRPEK